MDPRVSSVYRQRIISVPSREFRNQSWRDMVKVFELKKATDKELQRAVQLTALHCSHAIFVHRYRREWEPKPLLDVSSWGK